MDRTTFPAGGRTLLIRSLQKSGKLDFASPAGFATLLPAFDSEDKRAAEALVAELIDLGCVEFCCVGSDSEALHDAIDWLVEGKDALHVVTTWFEDAAEGCRYFVDAAGGGSPFLLALVAHHPKLVSTLHRLASCE